MDDRTLIICAATLCVVGVPLTQLLGHVADRSEPQIVTVVGKGDDIKVGALDRRSSANVLAARFLPYGR